MSLPLEPRHALMGLTLDALPWSHAEQARALCAAGARLIQYRTKRLAPDAWAAEAAEVVAIAHRAGALCLVNDSLEVALAAGADGAHLGQRDGDPREARRRLGPDRLLGGTVNDLEEARRAAEAGVLDYAGVGPWRFTTSKAALAPVQGPPGVARLVAALRGLPAFAIGGLLPSDVPAALAAGARGVAVSAALHAGGLARGVAPFLEALCLPPAAGRGARSSGDLP